VDASIINELNRLKAELVKTRKQRDWAERELSCTRNYFKNVLK